MTAHDLLLHERSRQEQAKQLRFRELFHIGRPVTVLSVALLAATAVIGSTINTMSYLDSISAALPVPTTHRVMARRSANTQTLALGSSVSSDSAGRVLAASVIAPAPSTEAQISVAAVTSIIASLVNNQFNQYLSQGLLTGPAGPPGPSELTPGFSGPNGMVQNGNGQTTSVIGGTPIISYIPASQGNGNYTGGSLAGFTNLSGQNFTANTENVTGNLTVQGSSSFGSATFSGSASVAGTFSAATSTFSTLTVSGPATFTGSTTIAGLTVTGFNPGLTLGSLAFQGAFGVAQDNANLFYDSINHRLGLGTSTPSQLLTVAGNTLVTGNATTSGNQIISGTLNVAGVSTLATISATNLTLSGPATLQSTLAVTGASTLATTTITNLTVSQAPTISAFNTGILHSNSSGQLSSTAVNLSTGDITGLLGVSNGGIGANTLTQYDLLAGNGTGAIATITPGTTFQILRSAGSGAYPVYSDIGSLLTAGSNIQITGTSTIAVLGSPSFTGTTSVVNLMATGNVGIGTTLTTGAPQSSVAIAGNYYGGIVPTTWNSNQPGARNLPASLNSWGSLAVGVLKTSAGTWKAGSVGVGLDVVWDSETGQYAMVYSGYDGTNASTMVARIGLAYSSDGITWTDYASNPIFDIGAAGQFDAGGMTFPQLYYENGTWYMYYIGWPLVGQERGTPSIGVATATSLKGPWIRYSSNPVLRPSGWASAVIYRPNVFKAKGLYYMFFNGGTAGVTDENVGYATAPSPLGPWTLSSGPVIPSSVYGGMDSDPGVFRVGDLWYMIGWTDSGSYVWMAHTTDTLFPTGWTADPLGTLTGISGIRPVVTQINGQIVAYAQSSDETQVSAYVPLSQNNLGLRHFLSTAFNQYDVGSQWGINGFTSGGAERFYSKYTDYVTTLQGEIGMASGVLGAITEHPSLQFRDSDGAVTAVSPFTFQHNPTFSLPLVLSDPNGNGASNSYLPNTQFSVAGAYPGAGTGDAIYGRIFVGNDGNRNWGTFLGARRTGTGGVYGVLGMDNNGTEVRSIELDESGNVGIGTTSPQYLLQVGSASVASGTVARFQNANGTCDINPTTNTLACSSDVRLKKDITPMTNDLAKVMDLQPVYFNWNAESAGTPEHPGFIAQQVQQVMPEVVSADPTTGLLSIGYSDLVPAVVGAMQQMQAEITPLQGSLTGNATTSNLTVYNPSNFSGDSVGEAEIVAGQTSVRVSFGQAYSQQAIVTFSPEGAAVPAFIQEKDSAGFSLALPSATTTDVTFDWHSFASPQAQLTVSDGTTQPIQLVLTAATPAAFSIVAPVFQTDSGSSPVAQATTSSTAATVIGTSTPATSTPAQTPTSNSTTASSSAVGSAATAAPAVPASSPPTVPPQSSSPDAAANSGDSSGSSGAPSTISAPAPSASPTAAPAQAPADPVAAP